MRKFLSIFIMCVLVLSFVGCKKTTKQVQKDLANLNSDDVLLSYTYTIANPSYDGQLDHYDVVIYNNGKTRVTLDFYNIDFGDEKYKTIEDCKMYEMELSSKNIDELKKNIVNNNYVNISNSKEKRVALGEKSFSNIVITLGDKTYQKGGENSYLSDEFLDLEKMINEYANKDGTFSKNVGLVNDYIEMNKDNK